MEIFLVIVVLAVIAAAAFMWYRSRNEGATGYSGGGPALRGQRGAARASRHDPMADAVERHAMATDPHEAAEAELRLQAQANRVAADLHAQQASALEADAGGINSMGRPVQGDGPPVYEDGQPAAYEDDGRPVQDDGAAYYDEQGRPVHPEDRPRY